MIRSENSIDYSEVSIPEGEWLSITFGNNIFIIVGYSSDASGNNVLVSTNLGLNWNAYPSI